MYQSRLPVLLLALAAVSAGQLLCGNGDIKLVGGQSSFEGRIEVCWKNEWGTVCDDEIVSREAIENFATVVCRQLGLLPGEFFCHDLCLCNKVSHAVSVTTGVATQNLFGPAVGLPIHLDGVQCSGDEGGIIDCSHNSIGVHDCSHFEDTGIICSEFICIQQLIDYNYIYIALQV